MIQALIITAISVGAGLLMLGGDNNEPPPPPAPAVAETPLAPLANALYWVGGCSVACSLIWGTSIVKAAQSRRNASAGIDHAHRETNR